MRHFPKGEVACAGLIALSLVGAAPAPAKAAGVAQTGPACATSYDVFATAGAGRCGVVETPAAAVTRLPDGGTSTVYRTPNATWTVNVPKSGFNAATATAAQLREYGVPGEPPASAPTARAEWLTMVHHMSFVPATPYWAMIPVKAGRARPSSTETYATSGNWAGYVNQNQTFNLSEATFTEPPLASSRCSSNSVVFWTGLGGWYGNTLEQNGTGENTPGLGQNQAWAADNTGGIQPVNLYATVGYNFNVETTYQGGNVFGFFWYNFYNGSSKSATLTTSSANNNRTTSETIVERPSYNNSLTNLSNFRTMQFPLAVTNGQQPITSTNYIHVTMTNNGHNLATVSELGSGGNNFSATQTSCN